MCHHVMRVKVSSENTSIKPLHTDYHTIWALFICKPVAHCKLIKHVCAAIQVLAVWYLYNRKQSILRKPHSSTQQCSLIRREVDHSSRKLLGQSICDKIITSVLNILTDVDNFGVLVHNLCYNSCHVFPHYLSLLTFPLARFWLEVTGYQLCRRQLWYRDHWLRNSIEHIFAASNFGFFRSDVKRVFHHLSNFLESISRLTVS
mmetsp:Transcript_16554/g.29954  ORF Transcript_16554/g.29954 Transcript_16554/m.29954 type:complete len:203 (+) Transcript_16554:798-1406(+)